jgi:hypothetical protein
MTKKNNDKNFPPIFHQDFIDIEALKYLAWMNERRDNVSLNFRGLSPSRSPERRKVSLSINTSNNNLADYPLLRFSAKFFSRSSDSLTYLNKMACPPKLAG